MIHDHLDLKQIIETLAMERHPTAGWYAPHYSDSEIWGRPKFSSIYYLLAGDEPMPSHKTDGIEVWHFHMGAPAQFTVTNGSHMQMTSTLGTDLALGQRPQIAVPAYLWQSCRSLGAWTLLGCTAAPGFSPRASTVIDAED
ncbi:cupin domain-containing protein [Novosphingobium resinovorum]|uniref:cupin domain-containing protein n=1 Tax=Novosphingobium resinovorum TaxID=158500 RepID=UPI002ED68AD2|nr:cupin domain-containing protein [Novosphingobium resinovorum]